MSSSGENWQTIEHNLAEIWPTPVKFNEFRAAFQPVRRDFLRETLVWTRSRMRKSRMSPASVRRAVPSQSIFLTHIVLLKVLKNRQYNDAYRRHELFSSLFDNIAFEKLATIRGLCLICRFSYNFSLKILNQTIHRRPGPTADLRYWLRTARKRLGSDIWAWPREFWGFINTEGMNKSHMKTCADNQL